MIPPDYSLMSKGLAYDLWSTCKQGLGTGRNWYRSSIHVIHIYHETYLISSGQPDRVVFYPDAYESGRVLNPFPIFADYATCVCLHTDIYGARYTSRRAPRSNAIARSNISQEANPMNKPVPMLSHNAFTNAINGIYDAHVSPLLKYFSPA